VKAAMKTILYRENVFWIILQKNYIFQVFFNKPQLFLEKGD